MWAPIYAFQYTFVVGDHNFTSNMSISSEANSSEFESSEGGQSIDDWEPSSEDELGNDESHTPSSTSLATSKNTNTSNSTSPKPNNPLQFNFELEEDGMVDIELWRCKEAYDAFPNQMIACPLGKDALDQYYGVDLDAHPSFKLQLDALELKYNEKPINHYKPKCSSRKSKKNVMEPLEVR